ncbi:conserved protein, unknown function [Plasmodium knowlesi strain H]|uniref:Uncharacterized protein n=1 Tax=Plasmodium knowlesi (strain H) TaxID=5851 RepID=B3L7M6_PLAKH|nr:conserved protein, unknown function [Plasmodium knowlesi strain H]CAA9989147.1 conserved protein, unknown function [Plasmodium knowlesi strain H]VVS78621.1 conserved protein, unknown function [Plasmodium knowlesi strain H]|eukprot:XP_002261494.1 hypothetical protein, conserved in Plasmodium species [Plasmodium knowlesi strain H]
MDKSNSEVDDWTEWLNDEEEKREDFNLDSTGKDEALKKKILQNNVDDIADFLGIDDDDEEKKKKKKKNEQSDAPVKSKQQEKIITLESTPLNSIKDCETLGEILASRIQESKAKSVAIERLLSIILPACEGKLEDKELQSINRKIQELIEKREKKKRYALINKKKPNEVKNALKNYKDEVDMIYGDLSYDEEDYENEDAEEFAEEY